MNKKKILYSFLLIFFFFLGFVVHALLFPTFLSSNLTITAKRTLNNKKAPLIDYSNKAITHVLYEEGEFDPQVVIIRNSYYLGIMNNSGKELMTLTSETPLFQTPRGYGLSEEHVVQLYDKGEYTVSSLLHPESVLKVIVK